MPCNPSVSSHTPPTLFLHRISLCGKQQTSKQKPKNHRDSCLLCSSGRPWTFHPPASVPQVAGVTSMPSQAQLNSTLCRVQPVLGISAASETHLFCFSNSMRVVSRPCLHEDSGPGFTAEPSPLGPPPPPPLVRVSRILSPWRSCVGNSDLCQPGVFSPSTWRYKVNVCSEFALVRACAYVCKPETSLGCFSHGASYLGFRGRISC